SLRRRPPLRFGRLLLAPLDNRFFRGPAADGEAARRRLRRPLSLRRRPPLRFGRLLLAPLDNRFFRGPAADGEAARRRLRPLSLRRRPPLRFGRLLLAGAPCRDSLRGCHAEVRNSPRYVTGWEAVTRWGAEWVGGRVWL